MSAISMMKAHADISMEEAVAIKNDLSLTEMVAMKNDVSVEKLEKVLLGSVTNIAIHVLFLCKIYVLFYAKISVQTLGLIYAGVYNICIRLLKRLECLLLDIL